MFIGVGTVIINILRGRTHVTPSEIAESALSLLKFDPNMRALEEERRSPETNRLASLRIKLKALSQLPLLLELMKLAPLANLELEHLLTEIRSSLLFNLDSAADWAFTRPCQSALALQCFVNEYVYAFQHIERQKIEYALESFWRSAHSLCFQLNRKYVPKYLSIFRCLDFRMERGEILIKFDDSPDEKWLILIYLNSKSPDGNIIIEDKSNPEKNLSKEFKPSEIFQASDMMVESLTQLLDRERNKKKAS